MGIDRAHLFFILPIVYFVIPYRSEGFDLTGYVVPGCVEDGVKMLWENSSIIVVAAAVLTGFMIVAFTIGGLGL